METVKIRSATATDIPAIVRLEKASAAAAHWQEEQYQAVFSSIGPVRITLVVEDRSQLQGFLVARAAGAEWEIENLAIAPTAQRLGLGARLLRHFLEAVNTQKAEAVFLEVRESNLAARSLYEKSGFAPSGRRKSYYREPEEDAVVYRYDFEQT